MLLLLAAGGGGEFELRCVCSLALEEGRGGAEFEAWEEEDGAVGEIKRLINAAELVDRSSDESSEDAAPPFKMDDSDVEESPPTFPSALLLPIAARSVSPKGDDGGCRVVFSSSSSRCRSSVAISFIRGCTMESIKRNVSRLEMPGAVAEAEGDVLVAPFEAAAAAAAALVLALLVAESDTTR